VIQDRSPCTNDLESSRCHWLVLWSENTTAGPSVLRNMSGEGDPSRRRDIMPHRRRFWPAIIRCVLCEVVTRGRFAVTSHAQLENVFLGKPLALSFAKTRSGRNRRLASARPRTLTRCQSGARTCLAQADFRCPHPETRPYRALNQPTGRMECLRPVVATTAATIRSEYSVGTGASALLQSVISALSVAVGSGVGARALRAGAPVDGARARSGRL
jgi:hypothetical protein